MTKPNYTHIHVLFDRSGSMSGHESDIDGWYKTFMAEQKAQPGTCTVSTAQFDTGSYETVIEWSRIQDIPAEYNLVPRGGTPLRDSVAKSIIDLGKHLEAMPENERPSKVIVIVHTDGQENSSREFTQEQIKAMVKEQEDKYSWEFVFLGAGIDAYAQGAQIGFDSLKTLSLGDTQDAYYKSATITSAAVSRFRSASVGTKLNYTPDEQKTAVDTKVSR